MGGETVIWLGGEECGLCWRCGLQLVGLTVQVRNVAARWLRGEAQSVVWLEQRMSVEVWRVLVEWPEV